MVVESLQVLVILMIFLFPVLPVFLILMPQVRSLKGTRGQRRQALEKLLISVGVLVAPCFLLCALERKEYGQSHGAANILYGVMLGVPLWAMMSNLLRLARTLTALIGRIRGAPPAHPDGWGGLLIDIVVHAFLFGAALVGLVFLIGVLEIGEASPIR
jgi:hypothetical protein